MEKLHGKVALVTGGGGGLGAALCQTLASAGANVIAADVNRERCEAVSAGVRAAGGQCIAARLDVTAEQDVDRLIDQLVAEYCTLDILVNNAGVDVTAPADELSVAQWDRILGVNLRGPFLMSRKAIEVMRKQKSGHIVNIVSTAAKRAWANASAYHASKWGLLGLSHALHVEARPHQVKVTAVIAGGMRTPFLTDRFPDLDPGVLQDPRNVADTVRFVLEMPAESVVPEIMVIPMRETSWP